MSESHIFHGDGRLEEDPAEFLGKLVVQTGGRSEADQLRIFPHYLAVGSIAREWYSNLPAATREDITLLQEAFGRRFRALPTTDLTTESKVMRLLDHTIKEEDVGTTIDTPRGPMAAHVVFATQMANLAAALVTPEALIPAVEARLPFALRQHLTGNYKTFDALADAIIGLQSWRVAGSDARIKELEDRINALSVHATPVPQRPAWRTPTPFTRGLDRAPPSTPVAATPMPPRRNVGLGLTTSPAATRERAPHMPSPAQPPQTPPSTPYVGGQRAQVSSADMADYRAKVEEWMTNNPSMRPGPENPFPLSPGTAPPGSRECFRCGMKTEPAHMTARCTSSAPIPELERMYRISIMRANNARNLTQPVRAIHFEGEEEEEYDYAEDDEDFQGNGHGAST